MPPPRVHRHRYHGVLAPKSPSRAQVTALAEDTTMETPNSIGEPTRPPAIALARAPPAWENAPVELEPDYDPLAQPQPEMEFDQRIQW